MRISYRTSANIKQSRPTATAPTTMPIPKVLHEAPAKRADWAVEPTTALGDEEEEEEEEEMGAAVETIAAHISAGRGILT